MRNLCWMSVIIRHDIEKAMNVFLANQVLVQELENGYLSTVQIKCFKDNNQMTPYGTTSNEKKIYTCKPYKLEFRDIVVHVCSGKILKFATKTFSKRRLFALLDCLCVLRNCFQEIVVTL